MPDIEKINNVAVADISKIDSITFAHGQKVNNQDVSLVVDAHTLISTHTASSDDTLDITSGIDSTYDVYEFHFVNIHPSADSKKLQMIASSDGGSSYGIETTSTVFDSYHNEADDGTSLGYRGGAAQSTSEIIIGGSTGFDDDQACSGIMTLYAPSSDTYVKHFTAQIHQSSGSDYANNTFAAGYINTASAINALRFSFNVGKIDLGTIKMYGLAKS